MRWCLVACVVLTTGCGLFAGLDDFAPRSDGGAAPGGEGGLGGSGAVGGDGGSGGIAGNPACTAAADWRSSFDAVWTFDSDGMLGRDASGKGRNLMVGSEVTQDTSIAQQGAASALITGPDGLATSTAELAGSEPLSWGMWLRLAQRDGMTSDIPFSRYDTGNNAGYRMVRGGAARAACQVGNGATIQAKSATTHLLEVGSWHHVVCRAFAEGIDQVVTVSFDGTEDEKIAYTNAMTLANGTPLEIASSDNAFRGNIDEAFVIKRALSDGAVSRIYACGIDGAGCCCSAADPTRYDTCGRFGNCEALAGMIACDAPDPP